MKGAIERENIAFDNTAMMDEPIFLKKLKSHLCFWTSNCIDSESKLMEKTQIQPKTWK